MVGYAAMLSEDRRRIRTCEELSAHVFSGFVCVGKGSTSGEMYERKTYNTAPLLMLQNADTGEAVTYWLNMMTVGDLGSRRLPTMRKEIYVQAWARFETEDEYRSTMEKMIAIMRPSYGMDVVAKYSFVNVPEWWPRDSHKSYSPEIDTRRLLHYAGSIEAWLGQQKAMKGFEWLVKQARKRGALPPNMIVWRDGARCGRCGKPIKSEALRKVGFGRHCAQKLGIDIDIIKTMLSLDNDSERLEYLRTIIYDDSTHDKTLDMLQAVTNAIDTPLGDYIAHNHIRRNLP